MHTDITLKFVLFDKLKYDLFMRVYNGMCFMLIHARLQGCKLHDMVLIFTNCTQKCVTCIINFEE